MMQAMSRSEFSARSWILSVLILTSGVCLPSQAQTSQSAPLASLPYQEQSTGTPRPSAAYTFSVSSQLVTLDVVVNDKHGQPVRGLKRGDFTIYEDNIPQSILSFEATEPNPVTGRGRLRFTRPLSSTD